MTKTGMTRRPQNLERSLKLKRVMRRRVKRMLKRVKRRRVKKSMMTKTGMTKTAAEFGKKLGAAYISGTVLYDLSDWYFAKAASFEFKNYGLARLPEAFSYCSMCSGSGMDSDVVEAVVHSLAKLGAEVSHRNLFMAEIVDEKQQFLLRTRCGVKPGAKVEPTGPCLFTDVNSIFRTGPCVAHHRVWPWHSN